MSDDYREREIVLPDSYQRTFRDEIGCGCLAKLFVLAVAVPISFAITCLTTCNAIFFTGESFGVRTSYGYPFPSPDQAIVVASITVGSLVGLAVFWLLATNLWPCQTQEASKTASEKLQPDNRH